MKKFSVAMFAVIVVAAIPALAATRYFQGFETGIGDWTGVTQVASGTDGITSAAGVFHAVVPKDGDSFTRFGGYESTFPSGGYTTAIDVYLDVNNPSYINDTRFDWSSAISQLNGGHRRDFIFNVGFYNDSDATGTVNRFVISASNNAPGWPKNPGRAPFTITKSGWYTFEHRFYKNASGVLAVDLTISTLDGAPVKTWTLSDPTDVVSTMVGGHRYGWFATQGFQDLAIDNASLSSVLLAGSVSACKNDGWRGFVRADGSTFTNQGDCIQYVNTAK